VSLLKAVGEHGSISAAAKSLNMSYKKAWSLLDAVNARAKHPVITSNIGGAGGGGAQLTDYGMQLIETFDQINQNCWKFLDKEIKNSNL
ncbi:MAG: LysR family transcriptional regulator, partial [Bacteroidia bacterium]|nr:LysR family transcriptional regulator [Bacteroidia bacterium]